MRRLVSLLFIVLFSIHGYCTIKVIKKVSIKSSIDFNLPPRSIVYSPEGRIREIGDKYIIMKDTFFEVFDKNFNRIKRVGQRGQGPGDFTSIDSFIIDRDQLYFSDFPNKLNLYDENFKFKKRLILIGKNMDLYIGQAVLDKDTFFVVQYNLLKKTWLAKYSKSGIQLDSFFNTDNTESRLNGIDRRFLKHWKALAVDGNNLFLAFGILPYIWKLDKNGKVLRVQDLSTIIKSVKYDQKIYKEKRKRNAMKGIQYVLESGDHLVEIHNWRKKYLLVTVYVQSEDYPYTGVIFFDKNLKPLSKIISIKGYNFFGRGKNLYFVKEDTTKDERDKVYLEVLVCDVKI